MKQSGIQTLAAQIQEQVGEIIVGKDDQIELMLTAVIASGHILLEDVPGTGKTLLAKTLASSMDCTFQRIQFTPDLLPSDLTGVNFYDQKAGDFTFRPGPLFANVVLADEINRATPRTQSSLLECMEEHQISVDGVTHSLQPPFIVLATQNPVDNQGTFPLPEAQMDRFMLKLNMGYPTADEAVKILKRTINGQVSSALQPVVSREAVLEARQLYQEVIVHDDLLRYIIALAEETRQHADVSLGVSPRGTQALLRAVQARAAIHGRAYALPDDVQKLAVPVLAHRLVLHSRHQQASGGGAGLIHAILEKLAVPAEEELEGSIR
ncbi:MoxR family ATPase [Paenibacillus sp. JX-17]|uniref:MoxR family ATPase n=1 Tax=Paenibacillus lacisoli TaxID=3064525 RepID=A0ABT9CDR6_9BACL|nr:MoxR family ATPase [Paenibacillus sp. JX-17]MDO7907414.1 MoxR family ATPase [Paenibacillus sp. JX-17]